MQDGFVLLICHTMFKRTNFKKWKCLSAAEKVAWLKAAFCLFCIGAALKVLSFSMFRNLYGRLARGNEKDLKSLVEVQRVTWAVRSAASHLPITLLCLPQALAVKYLLRNTATIELHIGVATTPEKSFMAHAWVEWAGEIIIGESTDGLVYKPIWHWK